MPTIAELIAEVQSSDWERGKDIARQLGDKISELESSTQTAKNNLQQQVDTILAVTAAEGTNVAEKLTDAAKKIAQLDAKNQELQETINTRETELKDISRNALFSEVGQKSGVKTNVLKTLIAEEDKLEVEGDRVKVNGTDIKEWAKTHKPDFYVALFPKTHADIDLPGGGSKVVDLPDGSSGSDAPKAKSPVQNYIDKSYKVSYLRNNNHAS